MQKHVTLVAALQIGLGILGVVIGFVVFLVLGWAGTFVTEPEAEMVLPVLALLIGGGLGVLSLAGIIGGIGLLKYKNWARILVLILSVFDLFNIPIGTAVAIYTFWVLVQDETARLFNAHSAPPPAS